MALVAEIRATARIVGEARFAGDEDGKAAEVAVVVDDEWQRRGIARQLLLTLHDIARADGYERLTCEIQANNDAMQALARTCGYRLTGSVGEAGGRRFEYHLRDRGA